MQQQQQQQMMSNAASIHPTHVTTEQIQQCLDENKQLILMIMENQNVGKFAECAPYQAQLQKNLMYLAKIADTQPPGGGGGGGTPTSFSMSPQPTMQHGHFMQHSQAPPSQPQQQQQQHSSPYASKLPFQLTDQQLQHQHQSWPQQQQFMHGQMGARPSSVYQTGYGRNLMEMRGGKQEGSDSGQDGMRKSAFEHNSGEPE